MKITQITCAGLRGATPEGGWSNELRPEDCVHTLIAVHTDSGRVGLGSVFTNDRLVQASLDVLQPLFAGENALEPERVSEKLAKQQQELSRHGVILLKVADAAKHVATVEETLNENLQALAVTQSFQEMFTSLSATLQLLTSRLSTLPADSVIELPRGKKSRGQAA